jgi:GalNAc-alpha-(1->4)-GalNAc-alpha-(1->3)-diNAcBac-PP-undecaprenol alpha-1,4-N-acetyl-D-galactosaminyltransferase
VLGDPGHGPADESSSGRAMRLVLVISQLGGGGAERVAATMANHWAAMGRAVTILSMDDGTVAPFYVLDARVVHVPLSIAGTSRGLLDAFSKNLHRIRVLRRAIRDREPDTVISFMDTTNVLTVFATRGLNVRTLVAEHQHPYRYRIGALWTKLRLVAYRLADRVVVLNEVTRAYFPASIQARTTVIPNPVVMDGWRPVTPGKPLTRPCAIAVGRLTEQKGHDILLEAFAKVKDQCPEWALVILGEGPLRTQLERLRDTLGLSERVSFPGTVSDPQTVLRQADLFVLASRWEAFPMALCEAMASGLPVLVTAYHAGVRDIVRDGIDGVIVPHEDVGALAAAMGRLMADPAERQRLGARGAEITERYGKRQVMAMWEDLLRKSRSSGGDRPRERDGRISGAS